MPKSNSKIKFVKSTQTNLIYRVLSRLDKGYKVESTKGKIFLITDNALDMFLPIYDDMGMGAKPYFQDELVNIPFFIQE